MIEFKTYLEYLLDKNNMRVSDLIKLFNDENGLSHLLPYHKFFSVLRRNALSYEDITKILKVLGYAQVWIPDDYQVVLIPAKEDGQCTEAFTAPPGETTIIVPEGTVRQQPPGKKRKVGRPRKSSPGSPSSSDKSSDSGDSGNG